MKSGFFLIDKPEGLTSFDIIRRLRRITGIKKMGHSGTLDPFATGLMIIAVGNGTRLLKFLEKSCKTYQASMQFGIQTDTGDFTGKVINQHDFIPHFDINELENRVLKINSQTPSKFSAIKIDGKKAYELARKEIDFEMKDRPIQISAFKILSYQYPELSYECTVSAGTYIRTLSEQIADLLNTIAVTKTLRRTAIENLHLTDSVKLDELSEDNWQNALIPYQKMFPEFLCISIEKPDEKFYLNGVSLNVNRFKMTCSTEENKKVFVFNKELKCIGLSQIENNQLKPLVIFNQDE